MAPTEPTNLWRRSSLDDIVLGNPPQTQSIQPFRGRRFACDAGDNRHSATRPSSLSTAAETALIDRAANLM